MTTVLGIAQDFLVVEAGRHPYLLIISLCFWVWVAYTLAHLTYVLVRK